MVDLWHLLQPAEIEFTLFSQPHSTFSTLDYFFCTNSLLSLVNKAIISELVISDHSPVVLALDDPSPRGASCLCSFLSYLANSDEFRCVISSAWSEYESFNFPYRDNPNIFWKAGKSLLRGHTVLYHIHIPLETSPITIYKS